MKKDSRTACLFKESRQKGIFYCRNELSLNINQPVTFKRCLECHDRDPDRKLHQIDILATPRSRQWGLRILFEKIELKRLVAKFSKSESELYIEKIQYDWTNSRILTCHTKFRGKAMQFKIRLNFQYPHEPPRCSDFSFEEFTGRHAALQFGEMGDLDMFRHACLGEIEQRWHSKMSIAQYLQLLIYYTAIEHFSQRI